MQTIQNQQTTQFDNATGNPSPHVAWGAILAGALAAAALSFLFLVSGTGLGLAVISPGSDSGVDAGALGVSSLIWLVVTQLVAAALGGYLAGRLRNKSTTSRSGEVYFRDIAHGFLAWALATLLVAVISAAGVAKVFSGAVSTGAAVIGGAAGVAGAVGTLSGERSAEHRSAKASSGADNSDALMKYMIDSLFRSDRTTRGYADDSDATARIEAGRIFLNSIHSDHLPAQDQQYLAKVISKWTDISLDDANVRVADTFNTAHAAVARAEQRVRDSAEKTREALVRISLWMFLSLLSGALLASISAAAGGKQRDNT